MVRNVRIVHRGEQVREQTATGDVMCLCTQVGRMVALMVSGCCWGYGQRMEQTVTARLALLDFCECCYRYVSGVLTALHQY